MAEAIKVLVIDDHPLFRAALELALIKAKISPTHIESASDIATGRMLMKASDFSLILLDLNLSDSEGFEGLSKIRAINPSVPIIIVSATETSQAFATASSLGATGYIPKSSSLKEITESIQAVLLGDESFPDKPTADQDLSSQAAKRLGSLTPAQSRVMSCLSDGLLNKQIAYEMGISEATVKAHMTAIFRKLGANNRTQALLVFRDAMRLNA